MRHHRFFILILPVVLLISGCATPRSGGEPHPQPASNLHNPQADFSVDLWSERAPLQIGDLLDLKLRTLADGYLSLYVINSSGKTGQLLQNRYARGGQTVTFPGPTSRVDFELRPPPGDETYILVATREPLQWLAPADIRNPGPYTELNFTGGQLLQRLQQVLEQQNPYSWNTQVVRLPLQSSKS